MDAREMNEGITWKELFQMLKEWRKIKNKDEAQVKAEVEDCNQREGNMPFPMSFAQFHKDDVVTWIDLLILLIKEKSFFGLRRDSKEKVSLFKERSSKKVLDYFFEKAWEEPILMSRND
jgi:hypothetical protein